MQVSRSRGGCFDEDEIDAHERDIVEDDVIEGTRMDAGIGEIKTATSQLRIKEKRMRDRATKNKMFELRAI